MCLFFLSFHSLFPQVTTNESKNNSSYFAFSNVILVFFFHFHGPCLYFVMETITHTTYSTHFIVCFLLWKLMKVTVVITLRKKREPKWLSQESHLVVRNSALCGALFWCYFSEGSPVFNLFLLESRFGKRLSFQTQSFSFSKHDYEGKKRLSTKESRFSKLLSKRAILALFFFSVNSSPNSPIDVVGHYI